MIRINRVVAGAAVLAIGLCTQARAQVLDQVPSNAIGVFHVKDLQGVSGKVAKLSKTLGIDQMEPKFSDPLAALMDQMGIKQGLNKGGDMAIAFFKPDKAAPAAAGAAKPDDAKDDAKPDVPPLVVILPVDDYKAFLTNFKDVKDAGGDISDATVPANNEHVFVVHRGKYAVSAMDKALLSRPAGFKLQGPAAKEAQSRDALLYFDAKAVRPDLQKHYQEFRGEMQKALKDGNTPVGEVKVPPFVFAMYDKMASQLISDTRSIAISFNLNDVGLGAAFLGDFESDSYLGKLVAKSTNANRSMLAGLPDRSYLMYGAANLTPEVAQTLFNDFVEVMKQNPGDLKKEELDKYVDAAKKSIGAIKSVSFGMVAPQPGENFMQIVEVVRGDAKQMVEASKQALPSMNAMMGAMDNKTKPEMKFGAAQAVEGVQLTPYTMSFNFDEKDAAAAQQKQIMQMMYGPNGLSGYMGAVNDQTFINVMGVSPKLLTDSVAAAKGTADPLGQSEALKQVADQLPKQRGAEFYVALDNIANTAVAVMKQQGMAVQFKLPPNLPPIGFSMSNEGSAARMDAFIPTRLVESMTAAVMQAMMQNNGAGKGV